MLSLQLAGKLKLPMFPSHRTDFRSHIFCIDCSNRCQLSGQRPICPACDIQLTNPDDVVVANLNPTEDYKTSVLSGLSPNVIMECAGRALNFWAYQTMQEMSVEKLRSNRCFADLLAESTKNIWPKT